MRPHGIIAASIFAFMAVLLPREAIAQSDCDGNLIKNPGFEDSSNVDWSQSGGLRSILTATTEAFSGSAAAWFGGYAHFGTPYDGGLSQVVAIPSGFSAVMTFMMNKPVGTQSEYFEVRCDGIPLYTADSLVTTGGTYAPITVDFTTFADNLSHTVQLFAHSDTSIYLDDICVTVEPLCETFLNLDELSAPAIYDPAHRVFPDYAELGIHIDAPLVQAEESVLGESAPNVLRVDAITRMDFDGDIDALQFRIARLKTWYTQIHVETHQRTGKLLESIYVSDLPTDFSTLSFNSGPIGWLSLSIVSGDPVVIDNLCITGDTFGPRCASNALYGRLPDSQKNPGYDYSSGKKILYQHFDSLSDPFRVLTWWGLYFDDSSPQFEVSIHHGGPRELGRLVKTEIVTASVVSTGRRITPNEFPEREFRAVLHNPIELDSGWVGIRYLGSTGSDFLWISSASTYPGAIVTYSREPYFTGFDLSLCLGPGSGQSEVEVELPHAEFHTADQNQDSLISLAELLRVIQFYNSGGLHCAADPSKTEDGYVPESGILHTCLPYGTDYNPQDWVISLSELLRMVQLYNAGGYHFCPALGTEDGFCPGSL